MRCNIGTTDVISLLLIIVVFNIIDRQIYVRQLVPLVMNFTKKKKKNTPNKSLCATPCNSFVHNVRIIVLFVLNVFLANFHHQESPITNLPVVIHRRVITMIVNTH